MKRKAKRLFDSKAIKRTVRKNAILKSTNGFGYQIPPPLELVEIYFDQKDLPEQAELFYKHYDDAFWLTPRGCRITNWKSLATDWIFNFQQQEKLRQRIEINKRIFNDM